jgi:hypothetical protein
MVTYQVRTAGLMRCCLATLAERMPLCAEDPVEGEIIHCQHHPDNGGMIFRDGVWEWNRPDDVAPWKAKG